MARKFSGLTKKYRGIEGLEELEAKLQALSATEQKESEIRREVRGVLRKGGEHIREAAIGFAPAHPRNIKQALISAYGKDKRAEASTIVMALFKTSPWWHWWEFGTGARFTKAGAYRGAIKPVKFLRRGLAASRPAVAASIASGLKTVIEKFSQ